MLIVVAPTVLPVVLLLLLVSAESNHCTHLHTNVPSPWHLGSIQTGFPDSETDLDFDFEFQSPAAIVVAILGWTACLGSISICGLENGNKRHETPFGAIHMEKYCWAEYFGKCNQSKF